MHRSLGELQQQIAERLGSEDFLQAETLAHQEKQIMDKLWDLFVSKEEKLDQEIYTSLESLTQTLLREAEATGHAAQALQRTKVL